MKTYRHPFALILLLIGIYSVGNATPCSQHPIDSTAVWIGTISVSTSLTDSIHSATADASSNVCLWRLGDNTIEYVIDAGSIQFSGDVGTIDSTSVQEILIGVSEAAVKRGIELGYQSCTSSCSSMATTQVFRSHCIVRSGSGPNTTLTACTGTNYCAEQIGYCCADGTSSSVSVEHQSTMCGASGSGGGSIE